MLYEFIVCRRSKCVLSSLLRWRGQYAKVQKGAEFIPSSDHLYLFDLASRANKTMFAITEAILVGSCYYGVIYCWEASSVQVGRFTVGNEKIGISNAAFGGGQVTESENFCFRLSPFFLSSFSPPHSLPWPSLNPSLLK
jgi:hypothetical protein